MELKDRLNNLLIDCTDAEVEDFTTWTIKYLWNLYDKECMDLRILMENKVKELPIAIPNGTAGKEYNAKFSIPSELVIDYWLDGLDKVGLTYEIDDNNICTIKGTPTEAGSFDVILSYKYKGWIEGKQFLQRKFTIAINPDSRTLWKNIPTPENIEYYQPDKDNVF